MKNITVKRNKVFIDSSILIAATLSHAGGSLYLLTLDNHFLSENVSKFAIKNNLDILKPRDFIEQCRNRK